MGSGDWLMAAGEAAALHRQTGMRVLITSPDGKPQWNEVFEGVPYLLKAPTEPYARVVSSSGNRPYIVAKHPTRWEFRPYKPKPAEIVLSAEEKAFAQPFTGMVMLEPNVKRTGHSNKAWEQARWKALAADPRFNFVQCGPAGTVPISGHTMLARTPTFRDAMAVLSVCRAFVGTEGGLMHAAAALGVPAVIIWSEFISPRITGYSMLRNLRAVTPDQWCGKRLNCMGCRRSMQAISVETVTKNLLEVLAHGG